MSEEVMPFRGRMMTVLAARCMMNDSDRKTHRLQPMCKRGHAMKGANMRVYRYIDRIKRTCIACEKYRYRRSLK